jgi:(2S)-methylsuccinyl-CoA dehydrogenase
VNILIERAEEALASARKFESEVKSHVLDRVVSDGRLSGKLAETEQRLVHGTAWISTTVAALSALKAWAIQVDETEGFAGIDELVCQIGFGEYLAQLVNGVAMSQNEIVRPLEFGLDSAVQKLSSNDSVNTFLQEGNTATNRLELALLLARGERPNERFGDETLDMIREQMRNFVRERISPGAHEWHLANQLIPIQIVQEMADIGTFGICIDPAYGGLGLNKLTMSMVSEEFSRGWICAGSLGTRSEIAGELIGVNGTEEQKQHWLPQIADGSVLPTAVFTEPDVGSDLASVRTRAVRQAAGNWQLTGGKTWITHASRADVMTVLARSNPDEKGYAGLSMFIASKTRGDDSNPFPDKGLQGTEIEVLGYRGMKEYELSFDGFKVDAGGLLGNEEGKGFKQLMQTFEGARIQTAARATGVAWNALDLALSYALERKQFGNQLIAFPRITDKLALMAVETVLARELTYSSAREKDLGHRCDIEAGMAKLLAARVAWSNADQNLQIHGGNGYALEYEASRLLCDARILNIFEGAAEIQAQVVGKGLLAAALSALVTGLPN